MSPQFLRPRRSRLILLLDLHLRAVGQRVGWIDDDLVAGLQAVDDLELGAEIAPDLDILERDVRTSVPGTLWLGLEARLTVAMTPGVTAAA